ncbi:MAG: prephenate dehydrogenase/arogenate dehydrogenase family protein [Candidatus Omnitrophica bacterium]|nr:prephenate dehydrogenase/arogenate dehydrogenase family protein [Candidatus Omnitrophota bacterium]
MKIFQSIGIAGIGLLGGSIALAVKERRLAERVYGFTRSSSTIEKALRVGAIDVPVESFSKFIEECVRVMLCARRGPNIERAGVISKTKPHLLFTDVGSTKKMIVETVENSFPPGHNFCGSHPMAGSEKRGIEFSDPSLFSGKTVIITPARNSNSHAIETIKKFWQNLDAKVVEMEASIHDEICAYTSHFPHVIAFLLIEMLDNLADRQQVKECIGPGFKDTTRIAASDQEIWSEIFISNCENIIGASRRFKKNLERIEDLIEKKDMESLKTWIEKAKKLRMEI